MILGLTLLLTVQVDQADSLTLQAAIARARERRGQIAAAHADVAQARAELRFASMIPNPTASYSYTEDTPKNHATIDQPLDWLLRRGPGRAAARAAIRSAAADSVRLVAGVVWDARIAFFRAVAAERQLSIVQDETTIADSLARVAARRFSAGEISQFEQTQADLEAARARALASGSRQARDIALAALARAIGTSVEQLPPLTGQLDQGLAEHQDTSGPDPSSLPLVRRALADSVAAVQAYRVERRARIPIPSLQAGIEWDDPGAVDNQTFGLVGFSLPLPLWHSGGAQAAVAAARADRAAAALKEARVETTRLLASTDVRVRESGRRAIMARDSLLPLAERQRDLALRAYAAGQTNVVAVLDALRTERQVAAEVVADLLAYQEAYADWLKLLGRT